MNYATTLLPLSDYSQEIEKTYLYRNSQIFIIYKKDGNKWKESSSFRAEFKHNIQEGNAEIRTAIISNNGEFIAVEVEAHPWVIDSKVPLIYIYDTKGNLFGSYIEDEIFSQSKYKYKDETKTKITDKIKNKFKSFKFNNDDTALIIEDTTDKKYIINLKIK